MTSEVTQAALEPCPFCRKPLRVVPSLARAFDPPRPLVEYHHADGDCIIKRAMWAFYDDEPEKFDKFAAAWNTRLTAQSGEGRSGAGEDWVSHDGGDCPVDPAATVEIKLRDGSVTTMAAKAVNWRYGTYIFEANLTMPASCEVVAYRLAALNARQSGEGEREALPRLDEGLIIAAMQGHYGKSATHIDGVDLTVNGYNWSFREGFKRMWAGVRKELNRRAALRATDDAGGA